MRTTAKLGEWAIVRLPTAAAVKQLFVVASHPKKAFRFPSE
jgi:hypothetical protein